MDVMWIILIGVLAGSLLVIWLVVRRWESRKPVEKPWQIDAAEKDAKGSAGLIEPTGGFDAEHPQPDIPVWRDKPTGIKE